MVELFLFFLFFLSLKLGDEELVMFKWSAIPVVCTFCVFVDWQVCLSDKEA